MKPSLFLLAFFLTPWSGWATSVEDLDGMVLSLEPSNESTDYVGIKTITIRDTPIRKLLWSSQSHIPIGQDPWPQYRIQREEGALHVRDQTQNFMDHPHLWQHGVTMSPATGLWAPLAILKSSTKRTHKFEAGLLDPNLSLPSQTTNPILLAIKEFRKVLGNETNIVNKDWENFVKNYQEVRVIDTKKFYPVLLENKNVKLPVMVVGNSYVEFVILRSIANPLVLQVSFKSAAVPNTFQALFQFFEENMGYAITEISTNQKE